MQNETAIDDVLFGNQSHCVHILKMFRVLVGREELENYLNQIEDLHVDHCLSQSVILKSKCNPIKI